MTFFKELEHLWGFVPVGIVEVVLYRYKRMAAFVFTEFKLIIIIINISKNL